MLSCEVSVESQLSYIAGEKYLQAGMWNFICFDTLWEVFSERCLEKVQCHLLLILFRNHQEVEGVEQTVCKDPSPGSSGLFPARNGTCAVLLFPLSLFLTFFLSLFIFSSSPPFYSLLKIFVFSFCKMKSHLIWSSSRANV